MALPIKVLFSGDIYSNTMTMTANSPTRFETENLMLIDVVIIVGTNSMLLGKVGKVVYPVGVGDTVGFTKVNLSTLYFKNATADSNGVITILGVKE